MATKIEWTDATWNPVTGCTKVSAGCKNCYAEGVAKRFWKGRAFTDVRLHHERLDAPLRWREPRRVFVNSMSDLFHEDVPNDFIDRLFAVMARAGSHIFQILTKRPNRMRDYLADTRVGPPGVDVCTRIARVLDDVAPVDIRRRWPLPNVWCGTSAEDQATADERIPVLLDTPAAVRFVSCEPLLGPMQLQQLPWLDPVDRIQCGIVFPLTGEGVCEGMNEPRKLNGGGLDWVIVGGESGPKARPCDVEWIRDIVRQCKAADVPVFVKQLGASPVFGPDDLSDEQFRDLDASEQGYGHEPVVLRLRDRKGGDPDEWPEDLRVREYPRKGA